MIFKKEVIDERVQSERFQALAVCGSIFSIGILSDILYKVIYLESPINTYLMELIIFFVAGLLYLILGIVKGILFQANSKKGETILRFKAFISSIAFATFFLISDLFTGDNLVFLKGHFGWTVIAFVTLIIISWLIDVFFIKLANRELHE
ncbi:hypothetical protein J6TS2_52780 [Heyndrickxia sporothermodurans]|nr:hypothetical protein J6TS2_52780 [Heyndrickxia sporothermodurans]